MWFHSWKNQKEMVSLLLCTSGKQVVSYLMHIGKLHVDFVADRCADIRIKYNSTTGSPVSPTKRTSKSFVVPKTVPGTYRFFVFHLVQIPSYFVKIHNTDAYHLREFHLSSD